ncbi:MAG: MopE-related protein [Sandaracinaceae bacterium]
MQRAVLVLLLLLGACDPDPDPGMDAGTDGGEATCARACDDGLFCNGEERCEPASAMADADGCVASSAPCATGCDEDTDTCGDCVDNPDADGDGADAIGCGGDDCDDSDPLRFPDASEVCDPDGRDEDCDPATFGARDADSDGAISIACCNGDRCGDDCNDGVASVFPGATETCNTVDDDCDGMTDEGSLLTFYEDADSDGFGSASGETRMACTAPDGFSANDRDCNDTTSAVNPGLAEVCDAFDDNDCNPDTANPFDVDGDGRDAFDDVSCPAGLDCGPADSDIYEGAPEICDGKDSDCGGEGVTTCNANCTGRCAGTCVGECDTRNPIDGTCDGLCTGSCLGFCSAGCDDVSAFRGEDADRDSMLATGETCTGGEMAALPRTDCDDMISTVFEGAPELCDRRDNDCDGTVDEGVFEDRGHPSQPVLREETFAMPDFACRGMRSRATAGGDVTRMYTLRDASGLFAPAEGLTVDLHASGDPSVLACTAPGCSSPLATAGEFTATHADDAVLGYRLTLGPARSVLGTFDTTNDPHVFSTDADAGELVVRVLDCAGVRVVAAEVRVYFDDGSISCGTVDYSRVNPRTPILPSPAGGVGELVTVEAWGRMTEGGALELLGRERARVSSDAATVLTLPPLRMDGPPAP